MHPKENLLRLLNGDNPAYIPYGLENVRTFWHRDAKFFFGNGDPNATEWTDIWGVDWRLGDINAFETFHPVSVPIKDISSLEFYAFPDPHDPDIFAEIDPLIKQVDRSENLLMLSNPGCFFTRAWLLRGMEDFLMDMLAEPERAEWLLDKILDYQIAIVQKQLTYKPDIVYFGDDMGTQRALIMRPDLFRRMLKPRLAKLTGMCRDAGCYVMLHTCGHIIDIIDDIIEIGVNILNPVQASANDLTSLKSKTHGRLTLYGGMDAGLLATGTQEEVKENAERVLEILGSGGGYIANPDQLLPFPKDNIDALRETVAQKGRLA
jgi:uroporphyrinogen decarboxylase